MGYSLIEIAYRLHRQTDDHSYYGMKPTQIFKLLCVKKKRRNSSIYVCWVRAYCATTINDHKCSIDRWQKWMTTWCVAMLSSAIVYWHDAPQFVTNEFCDWIYPTHSHIHISLQCIQKQQQQLGDRVEFNLPNNRKLKLRLCKTDSIWKLIDSYVNIFFAVISNQCVENLFSA